VTNIHVDVYFFAHYLLQEADVLVNVVSSRTPDLSTAGAVSVAFLDAAGDELQDVSINSLLITCVIIDVPTVIMLTRREDETSAIC